MNPKDISLNGTEFSGEYDATKSSGALWVVCWNIRNFSQHLFGRGETGRGIDLRVRLNQLIAYVKAWRPDVMFILECGPDADEACILLEKNLDVYIARSYQSAEVNGDPERYIVLYTLQVAKCIVKGTPCAPYGRQIGKYRRPVLLRLNIKGSCVCLLALHSPSPIHPLKDRIDVIDAAVWSVMDDYPDDYIILCGDLNIKKVDLNSLGEALANLACEHAGPLSTNSGVQSPATTSLCRFTTIMKTGESESQPYDQVWFQNTKGSLTVPSCYRFMPDLTLTSIRDNFWRWVARYIDDLKLPDSSIPAYEKAGLAHKSEIKAADKLLNDFEAISVRVLEYMKSRQLLSLVQKAPIMTSLKSHQDKIDNAMRVRRYDRTDGACAYIKDLLQSYIGTASMVLRLYDALTTRDDVALVTGAFEMVMSDHLPIAFCFKY